MEAATLPLFGVGGEFTHSPQGSKSVQAPALSFTILGKPEAGGSKRAFYNKHTGRTQIVDANKKAAPWKRVASSAAADAIGDRPPLRGPLAVRFTFYVRRPQGHFGKKGLKPSAPAHPTVRPDVLKYARLVEDSMTGIVYGDDAQIVRELLVKEYGHPERVEIEVREL